MKKIFVLVLVLIFSVYLKAQVQPTLNSDLSSLSAYSAISVTIGGSFITNGTFPASSTERLDEFITRIFNKAKIEELTALKSGNLIDEFRRKIQNYAKRGIKLIRADGSSRIIDLAKFRLTADFKYNPYLKNGDVIVFPPVDLERNFIEVEGAVNKPVKFQFVEGDRLSDALLFARGISKAYKQISKITITRLSYAGEEEKIIDLTPDSLNFKLKRGDRIRVVANETQKKDFKVLVVGEIYKPGYIFISKDSTTLKEVIEKAGGFKPTADLRNAELIRSPLATALYKANNMPYQNRERSFNLQLFDPKIDLLLMQRMANIDPEDSISFITDNMLRNQHAIASIDFNKVLEKDTPSGKFLVKDGDIINIPAKSNMVYIYGQVMNPGFIKYKPGADYNYYVSLAGGLGARAKNEIYLIKSKSRAWIDMTDSDNKYKIESGDFIWVPRIPYRNFNYYLQRVATYTSIVGSIATVALLIYQITKK